MTSFFFFFSSRRRHTRFSRDWSSDVCSSDLTVDTVIDAERGSALMLRGLVKRFDTVVAVGGVDLDVPVGSFFGLLGPNGAGKTTTLSMAVGLLRPDAGRALV